MQKRSKKLLSILAVCLATGGPHQNRKVTASFPLPLVVRARVEGHGRNKTRSNDQGFALITALWAALVLAVIVSFVIKSGRREAYLAHNAVLRAQSQALAEGAMALIELQLLPPDAAQHMRLDHTPFKLTYAGHNFQVRIQDQSGLIDLNFATQDTLNRLLTATAGLDDATASTLTDRILDWREKGVGHRLNGAKATDYAAAGLTYAPREAPFESLAELRLVMGMTEDIFTAIAPALTVYSQKPVIDPAYAPLPVLLALPGMTQDTAEQAIANRADPNSESSATNSGLLSLSSHALEIEIATQDRGNVEYHCEEMIRVMGSSGDPFWRYKTSCN